MRFSKDGTHYEYIAVYGDDLAICMKDHQAFLKFPRKYTNSSSKELDNLVIILVVDIAGMQMEHLLQIQGNMLTRFLIPMEKCVGRN